MKIGIAGVGIVGGALLNWLSKNTKHEIYLEDTDPSKNMKDDLSKCEAIFICVPVDTLPSGAQDLTHVKSILKKYKDSFTTFYLRSSVLPKTCDNLCKQLKVQVYACPEFLTERTANDCTKYQSVICGARMDNDKMFKEQEERLQKIFLGKTICLMQNREAELAKYAHNIAGALKVNFFNMVAKYAEKIRADYSNVLDGVYASGHISPVHTMSPGPDGKRGFGGKCFPKDTMAFIAEANRIGLQTGSLECMMVENLFCRVKWEMDFKPPQIVFPEGIQLFETEQKKTWPFMEVVKGLFKKLVK